MSILTLKSKIFKKCLTLDRIDTLQTFKEPYFSDKFVI